MGNGMGRSAYEDVDAAEVFFPGEVPVSDTWGESGWYSSPADWHDAHGNEPPAPRGWSGVRR